MREFIGFVGRKNGFWLLLNHKLNGENQQPAALIGLAWKALRVNAFCSGCPNYSCLKRFMHKIIDIAPYSFAAKVSLCGGVASGPAGGAGLSWQCYVLTTRQKSTMALGVSFSVVSWIFWISMSRRFARFSRPSSRSGEKWGAVMAKP